MGRDIIPQTMNSHLLVSQSSQLTPDPRNILPAILASHTFHQALNTPQLGDIH